MIKKFKDFINEKVHFFDKNGKWFSTSNSLSDVRSHKERFGDDITFSVDGYEKEFKNVEEFENYKKIQNKEKEGGMSPFTLPKTNLK